MRLLLALLTLIPLAGAANHGALRNPNDRFWRRRAPQQYRVRVETSRGAFVLEVHRDWAPLGADRFFNLVRAGFYDDSRFYRVTARFAQFGIAGVLYLLKAKLDLRVIAEEEVKATGWDRSDYAT